MMPNFLIVGAAKAGTTSLYSYLKQHPDIFMSLSKEPSFFAFAGERVQYTYGNAGFITDFEEYQNLFKDSKGFKCRGEASTPYLYFHEKTIHNIKQYVSDHENLKIIIVLRNPVDRAYSQYMMKVRDLREPLTFEQAIKSENSRMSENYHFDFFYIHRGYYYEQVKAFMDNFKYVRCYLYDDMRSNLAGMMADLCSFLGVDDRFTPNSSDKHNVSGLPKSRGVQQLIVNDYFLKRLFVKLINKHTKSIIKNKIININTRYNLTKVAMLPSTKNELINIYINDIELLSTLISRDLTMWLKE